MRVSFSLIWSQLSKILMYNFIFHWEGGEIYYFGCSWGGVGGWASFVAHVVWKCCFLTLCFIKNKLWQSRCDAMLTTDPLFFPFSSPCLSVSSAMRSNSCVAEKTLSLCFPCMFFYSCKSVVSWIWCIHNVLSFLSFPCNWWEEQNRCMLQRFYI